MDPQPRNPHERSDAALLSAIAARAGAAFAVFYRRHVPTHQRLRARRPDFPGPAGPRPPRRRSEALAVLAAVAVAAAVVAIVVLNVGTSKPHHTSTSASRPATVTRPHTATTPPPQTTTGAAPATLPAHFTPQSFTAISELTWWLLGPGPCASASEHPPCGSILRTTDGGPTFAAVPAPAAPLAGTNGGYTQLRFADANNGFAFDPGLYATHDGGQTWHAVAVGGVVADLAISSGQVYAIVNPSNARNATSPRLMRSPVGQDAWSTVSAAGVVTPNLWVQGSDVILGSGAHGSVEVNLLVSQDAGASFTAYPSPSPGFPCRFQAPSPPVLWAECPTGTESGVWRSTDLGAHFATAGGQLRQPNSAVFAAASATTAVYGYQQLYRTTDAGASWAKVGPSGVTWAYVGFSDATHGVAIGYVGSIASSNERLYYTTDGGQSYHLVPLP